ncbi:MULTISPECIES: hypothetical protein [unclassified Crossiella]|uniref:hypothetical protein n=1 Tax=unclassified Crossiella TaxID=2620835 RepID=UPI001FFF8676|nr:MULTISPECIES: hypothetical protein [unclassified Crossiella]MCK2238739.1 hypothetical protein [Crossiella sp. S99.2]MCK2251691.1 hypothetical protein [Crossiella sp. S99.1]
MNRRVRNAMGIGVGVVLTVTLVAFIAGCWILKAWDGMALERSTYDAVSVGQSKAEADRILPHGSSKMLARYRQQGPPKPRGANCRHFLSKDEQPSGRGGIVVYRFCFVTNTVVEKSRFEAVKDNHKNPRP